MTARSVVKVLADLSDATLMARALVARGREEFEADEMLRLAAEAILGRIGDAAAKLHDHFGDELPREIPWREVVGNRILVDHAYHRLDYSVVWATLSTDVPELRRVMNEWAAARQLRIDAEGDEPSALRPRTEE